LRQPHIRDEETSGRYRQYRRYGLENAMDEKIDRLCDQLRIKLHGIDRRLEALKANGMNTSEKSRHAVESQLDRVEQRIYDRRGAVEAANARVTAWLQGKKAAFDADVEAWKEHRQVHRLNSRADDAEAYAVAVFELAAAAADEAAHAALEALLARNDANGAALPIASVQIDSR
jgi:DNA-binding transcriptional MerR regulator